MSTAEPPPTPAYLTRDEAAVVLRISLKTLDKMLDAGTVPAVRLDRTIRIPAAALVPTEPHHAG